MVVVSPPRLKILAKAAKAEGTSVREQGVRNGNQRNLNPITCLQEEYVCEWKSDHVSSKNKYAICVEDDSGNFESKCVDAKLIKSGNYRSDTIAACGCCEVDTSGTSKGGFKDCLSILQTTKPDHCNEAEFTCQVGSREGKRRAGTSYCAKIAIGKGSTLTFGNSDECGDPFNDIKEEQGEEFLNCGSCPSTRPTESPSAAPSAVPSFDCGSPCRERRLRFLSWLM